MPSPAGPDKLCELAFSYGATAAVVLEASAIVLDSRVRLKCMIPRCANYNHNLMCPPNVMSVDEFSKVLGRYRRSIVIQYPIPLDKEFMNSLEGQSLGDIYESGEYKERITKSEREFQGILNRLESDALQMGYRFATALTGGPCRLCDECVGQASGQRCRHPFQSRPSMEAMGIDVYLTAKNAGIPFEVPAKDGAVWNGLLLID
ncbi:MAG: DUF2284 domain-containing protein [Euryarchaeota archaeon]|nr:DUF2284 domain-containing protein [Euryarchaeota archaeon]